MEAIDIENCRLTGWTGRFGLCVALVVVGTSAGAHAAKLFQRVEESVVNPTRYANPFTDTELRLDVTAPSGRRLGSPFTFYGFHDGDGRGGQSGEVWKFRLLFDHAGDWTVEAGFFLPGTNTRNGPQKTFAYTVSAEQAPNERGHVYVDSANWRRLRFADGTPWVPVTMVGAAVLNRKWPLSQQWIDEHASRRLNAMGAIFSGGWEDWYDADEDGVYHWLVKDGSRASKLRVYSDASRSQFDYTRFDVAGWRYQEKVMDYCYARGIYLVTWYGMSANGKRWNVDGPNDWSGSDAMGPLKELFLKYLMARWGAHPVWWMHTVSGEWDLQGSNSARENAVAAELTRLNPWKTLVTSHPSGNRSANIAALNWPALSAITTQEVSVRDITTEMAKLQRPFWRPVFNAEGYPSGSETGAWGHEDPDVVRAILWRELMDGGFVQAAWYRDHDPNNSVNSWGADWRTVVPPHKLAADQCGIQQRILNETPGIDISRCEPHHELVAGPPQRQCLAEFGSRYYLYLRDGGSAKLDLRDVSGTFNVLRYRVSGIAEPTQLPQIHGGGWRDLGNTPQSGKHVDYLFAVTPGG